MKNITEADMVDPMPKQHQLKRPLSYLVFSPKTASFFIYFLARKRSLISRVSVLYCYVRI